MAALTKAAALAPKHPMIRLNLANALRAAGQKDAAVTLNQLLLRSNHK